MNTLIYTKAKLDEGQQLTEKQLANYGEMSYNSYSSKKIDDNTYLVRGEEDMNRDQIFEYYRNPETGIYDTRKQLREEQNEQ